MIDSTLLDESPVVPVHERCRYPSKFCRFRRSVKRNGEFHRFCDHHRTKANLNQKRWSKNRRGGSSMPMVRTDESDSDSSPMSESLEPAWERELDLASTDAAHEDDELQKLATASSFTSMLAMLQPSTTTTASIHALPKQESFGADEQLSEFLRELLLPQEGFALSYGTGVVPFESYAAMGAVNDVTLIEL